MSPSWYDVLGVDPDADAEEIRAAWKAGIADLGPGDRRFRTLNTAAETLLDPQRRAAHDEELAEPSRPPTPTAPVVAAAISEPAAPSRDAEPIPEPVRERRSRPRRTPEPATVVVRPTAQSETAAPARWARTVVVGVLALALLTLTAVAAFGTGDREAAASLPDARQIEAARAAAEAAVVPVLSYDYRTLPEDRAEAGSYLTDAFRADYDRLFDERIAPNARSTKAVIGARLIDSAIALTGPDRVDVLLFVNRPYRDTQSSEEYRDQVTLQMVAADGTWLVDCMITVPESRCAR